MASVVLYKETNLDSDYKSKIVKHTVMNHLCAYVFLSKNHPFFEMHYDEINNIVNGEKGSLNLLYELTYSGIHDDGWCIGFDTAQSCNENQLTNKTSLENTINVLNDLVMWLTPSA
jgi:hypothetical protein